MSHKTEMKATGRFTVDILPQQDEVAVGRMLIEKQYEGELEGTGKGQMLSKQVEGGNSVYCAIEEFQGRVGGKAGSFTLLHYGKMSSTDRELDITVIEGSGSNALTSISGKLHISQNDDGHTYIFDYSV